MKKIILLLVLSLSFSSCFFEKDNQKELQDLEKKANLEKINLEKNIEKGTKFSPEKIENLEKEYQKNQQLIEEAISKNSLKECEKISDKKMKTECITLINEYNSLDKILSQNDEKKCEELKDKNYIEYCKQEIIFKKNIDLAIKNKDLKVCQKLEKKEFIDICENFVKTTLEAQEKNDETICESLPEYTIKNCKDYL